MGDGTYRYGWVEDGIRRTVFFLVKDGRIHTNVAHVGLTPLSDFDREEMVAFTEARMQTDWPYQGDCCEQVTL